MVFIPFADSNVVCSKSVEAAAANISHIGLRSILDEIVIKDSYEEYQNQKRRAIKIKVLLYNLIHPIVARWV